jgi:hypothetical protein
MGNKIRLYQTVGSLLYWTFSRFLGCKIYFQKRHGLFIMLLPKSAEFLPSFSHFIAVPATERDINLITYTLWHHYCAAEVLVTVPVHRDVVSISVV